MIKLDLLKNLGSICCSLGALFLTALGGALMILRLDQLKSWINEAETSNLGAFGFLMVFLALSLIIIAQKGNNKNAKT